ncbi:GSCOCG00012075001-RA-CDS [Cotesia congregata]|nr:GSCOCG00012075001-RA-CDS [Cotesia congregata]
MLTRVTRSGPEHSSSSRRVLTSIIESSSSGHSSSNTTTQTCSAPRRTSVGFLETLNAKLATQKYQQHQQQLQQQIPQIHTHLKSTTATSSTLNRSASVRRIMVNRVPIIDPLQVRDSLVDQLRRSTSLRKTTGTINDWLHKYIDY